MPRNILPNLMGSEIRPKMIRFFLDNPKEKFYQSEVARALKYKVGSIQYELDNLTKMGFLKTWWTKTRTYYELNPKFFLLPEIKSMVKKIRGK